MKRIIPVFLSLFFISLFMKAPAFAESNNSGQLIFDSSQSAKPADWEFTDAAAWTVRQDEDHGQVLALEKGSEYEPPVRSPLNIAWLNNIQVSDFVFEVEAMSTSREYGHRDLCFFFGKQSDTEFYYVHIATAADSHANSIFLVNNEPRIAIAEKRTEGTKWENGKFHRIRIERSTAKGTILVFFDDMKNPIMEAVDKSFSYGFIGLGSFDDVGEFRNLKISKLED
jgi:hypothetical protein